MPANIEKALNRASFAVIVHTAELEVREWNAGAEKLFGYTAKEAIGQRLPALIGTKERPRPKDGRRLACQWHEEKLDDGTVLALATDITDLKTRERVLQMIFDNLEVVAWQLDSKRIFTFHDGAKALASIGLKPGQVVGLDAFQLYPDAGAQKVVLDALAGATTVNETEALGRRWKNWSLPLYDENHEIEGATGLTLDITEAWTRESDLRVKLELIESQQSTIRELSIPLIETWEGVLTVPMVGVVDTGRASEIMETLLTEITRRKARFAIVDLTGVDVVDTAVAGHIIGLTRSIKLLGAEGIVTGIRPSMAQTMVALGADLSGIRTLATLREALRYCIDELKTGT